LQRMTSRSISNEFIVASLSMCADTGTPRLTFVFSGVRIGRNVGAFSGEGSYWRDGSVTRARDSCQ
jgi:hypothetical protein